MGPHSGSREDSKQLHLSLKRSCANPMAAVMECVAMGTADRVEYDTVFHSLPFELRSKHWLPVTRKRWFLLEFEPACPDNVAVMVFESGEKQIKFVEDIVPTR